MLLEITVLRSLEKSNQNICDRVQIFWSSKVISKYSVKVDCNVDVCQRISLNFQNFKGITKCFEFIETGIKLRLEKKHLFIVRINRCEGITD